MSKRCRPRSPRSARACGERSTTATKSETRIPPTSSPRFLAASTSTCGSWKRISDDAALFLPTTHTKRRSIMSEPLEGKRVAILMTNGVEQVELTEPRVALELAGAKTEIVSPAKGRIQAMNHDQPGDT